MSLTQSIADSLGVADEGLRLILGQVSGMWSFSFSPTYISIVSAQFDPVYGQFWSQEFYLLADYND